MCERGIFLGHVNLRLPQFANIAFSLRHGLLQALLVAASLVALVLSTSSGSAAPAGLVAAYAFDEGSGTTVADASGNGNTGTVTNATWTTSGKYGNALTFNGTNARINVPSTTALQLTGGMTLEAWVNPTTVSNAWRDVIYKGNDNYYLEATSTGGSAPDGGGTFGGRGADVRGTTALTRAVWSHIAVTYDGTTLRLYINGAQTSSQARTGSITTSTNPLQIGGDSIYGQYFSGSIDDVRVYNRPLSAAEIQTDMSTPVGVGGTTDTQPPTAPSSLAATAQSSTQVNLNWTAATDNIGVTGYRIERCAGSGCSNFAEISAPAGTGTTFSDTGLTAGTAYTYRVRAADAAGNLGPYSNTSTATTAAAGDTQPPTAPTALTATAQSSTQINLSWTAATDNVGVTGYRIERCTGSGCTNFAQIAAPAGTGTTYNDTGLTGSTTYAYRVRAIDGAGNLGPYSNTSSASTPAPSDTQPPTAPGSLTASAFSATQVNLSWTAATDNVGVTGYRIERCTGSGCSNFAEFAAIGTATQYFNTGISSSTTYTYRVRATDAAGNLGPYSNTASATTPAAAVPGLVAAYSFDEGSGSTVTDASGNGNVGSLVGAAWSFSGKYGGALSFTGSNARVDVANSSSLQLTSGMTLEAWVKPAVSSSAWRDVIYKGNDNYYLEASSDSGGAPAAGGLIGGSYGNVFGTTILPTNTWTYLAVTYDGGTLRLYINGTLSGSQAKTGSITTSTNPLQIGGDSLYGQYFNGLIDEIRVYNSPLPATSIQDDMAIPVSGGGSADTQPPSAPGTLSAAAINSGEIDLNWGLATDNVAVTGYQVLRCQGAGCVNYSLLAPTGTITSYQDTGLTASTSYSYEVRAVDAAGNLGPVTNSATATTPANADTTPPSAPGALTSSAVGSSEIDLTWGTATDNVGVAGYRIDRCQGTGCSDFSHLVQLNGPATAYNDTGLVANTSYSYQVRAVDGAGNLGSYSNVTTATTTSLGLVASYSFDEGSGTAVSDASGNGNTGTISNATWTTNGKYGRALSFNGSSARVNVPNSASLQLATRMTLEAWVNPTTVSAAWRDVIYKGTDNYYIEGTSAQGGAPAGGGTFGGAGANATAASALPANSWSHLALTYDGAALRLYVNGNLVATQSKTGTIATSTSQLQIGGDGVYGQYFSGLIDEVRIYNTALTAVQIQADMNQTGAGVPSVPSNLTATAKSSTQIDLAWGPSTDAAGVTGYRVERCQGDSCSNFVQVAAPTTTSYSDTGLTSSTSYSYRVRAIDAANVLGPYSTVTMAFTGLFLTPKQSTLTPGQAQQFTTTVPGGGTATVTWSVDGISGGSSSVGAISTAGVYTAPTGVGAGTHIVSATSDGGLTASSNAYVTDYAGSYTYHSDNLRTGQNLNETVLTPANVNPTAFGKLFTLPLDGLTLASPLYVENVAIPGQGTHNVVYIATEHDSVYAYDADGKSSTPLWKTSFIDPAHGITTVPAADTGECCDIAPEIGITSTPVIDPVSKTIYVVAKTKEGSGGQTNYVQRLHALDLTTGAEKFGGPVVIQASVPGTGNGSVNGQLPFDSLRENQRTGLLLLNGNIYFAFASHGDNQPYHGWVLGYNATTLQQTLAFCATPNTEGAGIWMSGAGIASDATGSLYYITGDGEFDGTREWGDSYIRMTPAGVVSDYFTPMNQDALNQGNHDLGSGGALLLPDQPGTHPHEMVSSGKDGTIYLVDRDNMGHYSTTANNIVQTLPNVFPHGTPEPGNFIPPVYYGGYVFFSPLADNLQGFKLTNGLLATSATLRSAAVFPDRGGPMAVSANGSNNGILWAVQRNGTGSPGVLYAYDPLNSTGGVLKELYDSSAAGSRDTLDIASKFSSPLVANGKVFVAGVTTLTVYGLLP